MIANAQSYRGQRLGTVCFVLLLLCAWLPAWSHPNDSKFYAMRTLARLGDGGLRVIVSLEVPISDVIKEFEQRYITSGEADPNNLGQDQIDEFTRLQWNRLASGLTIKTNGEPPEGTWLPVDTPINGRANAGFFVYMLWFKTDEAGAPEGQTVTLEVENRSFPDTPKMFLSGYADCRGGWEVQKNSAQELLGAGALVKDANTNPESWTLDPAMRRLQVVFARTED